MCTRRDGYGVLYSFTCPERGQDRDLVECCGRPHHIGGQFCCPRTILHSVGFKVGLIIGCIVFVILLFIFKSLCCGQPKERNENQSTSASNLRERNDPVIPTDLTVVPSPAPSSAIMPSAPLHVGYSALATDTTDPPPPYPGYTETNQKE